MTYCLAILLPAGLVMASDSRSNAGVDQIVSVRKMARFGIDGHSAITILSAGNLATTQCVISIIHQAAGRGEVGRDILAASTMFDVANLVGTILREVIARDGNFVRPYGDPDGSFLIGGQIAGDAPRLFQIYSAGNFVEASDRANFLQIGETKYGKPILDRALHAECSLDEAAKLALLSFDATMRSNLSVDAPIDLWRYLPASFSTSAVTTMAKDDPYWTGLRHTYAQGLSNLVASLPLPPA
jgi:putative proteasome-type protease